MQRKVVIVSDNFSIRDKVKRYCERSENYVLVDAFGEAFGFLCWLRENPVETNLVFVDMFLYHMDGLQLLKILGEEFPELDCIFMCPNFCENVGRRALERGARLVLDSDFELVDFIDSPTPQCQEKEESQLLSFSADLPVEQCLDNICVGVGIPPHIRGYRYLKEAILACVEKPAYVKSITRKLYPHVANKFQTSPNKVERAIRHAMDVADIRKRQGKASEYLEKEFQCTQHKLTSTEFIALATDKLMDKCCKNEEEAA